jgi:Domain of unknown function (DUF4129)
MNPPTGRPVEALVGHDPRWRAVALVGLTVALLAVVAVASGGVDVPGVRRGPGSVSSPTGLSAGSSEYLLLLAIAGVAGMVVLLAFAFLGASWSTRGAARDAGEGTRIPRWLGAVLLVAVAAFPIAITSWFGRAPRGGETVSGVRRSVAGVPVPELNGPAASSDGWSWTPIIAAVGIALGATAVAAVLRTRERRRRAPARRSGRAAAAAALDRTIDDLRRDPDPRHAVISAYAWMEDELTASGWGRRPSEAPFEYLDDALRELAVPPAPARSLTELFEVARFSRHRVDPSMKDRAIAALVEIRGSLREEPSR